MRLQLRAVGTRMPRWVNDAVGEYAVRLPKAWQFELREVAVARTGDEADAAAAEGARLLQGTDRDTRIVAFDEQGEMLETADWARAIGQWQQDGAGVVMLVGGAAGLSPECRSRASRCWSLSRLTLPHGMARAVIVEQLYRASSILAGHPYHRAGRPM